MTPNFLICDREQPFLMPPSLDEWLPDDHLAWSVIDAVEQMDLGGFYASYRQDGWGRAAHDPKMMVTLMLYAYATGERSSRRIERCCHEDVGYRVICANQTPDHATIARFRARHQDALADLFGQILQLCQKAGMVSVGLVALDSTKIAANASGHVNRTYEQLAKEILAEAEDIDAKEDELYGDKRGDELPPELSDRRRRRERLREAKRELEREREHKAPPRDRKPRLCEAKQRLEAEHVAELRATREHEAWREKRKAELAAKGQKMPGRPPTPTELPATPQGRINTTDLDSTPVKTHRGFIQGYNAQALATEDQIILCAEIPSTTPDGDQLEPMVDAARIELKRAGVIRSPDVVLADAGYWNNKQIDNLAEQKIKALVPPDGHARTKPPPKGKRGGAYAKMRRKLKTKRGAALYRRRKQIIEPIFGQTKVTRRADRFHRRGLEPCRAEWKLIAATHNLMKLHRNSLEPAAT